MNRTLMIAAPIIGIVLVAAAGWYLYSHRPKEAPVATATFSCDADKNIAASFYKDSVSLTLSDGRSVSVPQTISGSGARYANKDESFVFWNKGNTAFITEGSPAVQTFSNCIAPDAAGNLMQSYTNGMIGFTLQFPKGYIVNESYAYDQFGPKKLIKGVSFTIPESMATGTNLATDTRLSIEQLPNAKKCTGDIYLKANVKAHVVSENGVDYSIASSSDAAAGNRYTEVVYALVDSKPCTAVRYFIHSGAIENYPANTVAAFDQAKLLSAFDEIRGSLNLNH